jgi:hypothetical protein
MITADGFDDCILGRDSKERVVYDAEAMLDTLMIRDDMTREEAEDFFWYNIDGSHLGDETPIYVFLNYDR